MPRLSDSVLKAEIKKLMEQVKEYAGRNGYTPTACYRIVGIPPTNEGRNILATCFGDFAYSNNRKGTHLLVCDFTKVLSKPRDTSPRERDLVRTLPTLPPDTLSFKLQYRSWFDNHSVFPTLIPKDSWYRIEDVEGTNIDILVIDTANLYIERLLLFLMGLRFSWEHVRDMKMARAISDILSEKEGDVKDWVKIITLTNSVFLDDKKEFVSQITLNGLAHTAFQWNTGPLDPSKLTPFNLDEVNKRREGTPWNSNYRYGDVCHVLQHISPTHYKDLILKFLKIVNEKTSKVPAAKKAVSPFSSYWNLDDYGRALNSVKIPLTRENLEIIYKTYVEFCREDEEGYTRRRKA